MKILGAAMLAFLLAGISLAADITGKWVASMPGRDGNTREVVYNLKADGSTLTGTTTGMGGQEVELQEGKIDGDNVSFKIKREFNGNTMVMVYKGVVSGDEIKFSQTREGGDRPPREFTAKRAK
jgi:hypothetical protein